MNNRDMQVNVPWEATAAVFAAIAGLPLLVAAVGFLFFSHGKGTGALGIVAAILSVPLFVWFGFALRSRVRKGQAAGESVGTFFASFFGALGLMLGVIGVFVVLAQWSTLHTGVYVIPSAAIVAVIVHLVRIMVPPS
jgi:hypothetical protein